MIIPEPKIIEAFLKDTLDKPKDEKFVWTDDLWKEFELSVYRKFNDSVPLKLLFSYLEEFKQSNQQSVSNKDWEIVCGSKKEVDGEVVIDTVKRLSDGKVFSIGDEVCNVNYVRHRGKINKIEIQYGVLVVQINNENWLPLTHLLKVFKEPLFTTEDGKNIYEGDDYWFVSGKEIIYNSSANSYLNKDHDGKRFSSLSSAEEYVLKNTACLSFDDVCKIFDRKLPMKEFCELNRLVKEKIGK